MDFLFFSGKQSVIKNTIKASYMMFFLLFRNEKQTKNIDELSKKIDERKNILPKCLTA